MAYTLVTLLVLALAICRNTARPVAPAASTGATNPLVIPSAATQFLEAHNQLTKQVLLLVLDLSSGVSN